MKKLVYLFIFHLLIFTFVLAQNFPYFSIKKTSSGLMIGVEVFNQKTNFSLKPDDYSYKWTFTDISLIPSKTASNIFSLPLKKFFNNLFVDLEVFKPLTQESYYFKNNKLIIPSPEVKIVRKSNGFLLPVVSKLNKNDILTVVTKNFSSPNLNYFWELNDIFITNEKEISVNELGEKTGTIKVKVFGSFPWERAEELINFQLE